MRRGRSAALAAMLAVVVVAGCADATGPVDVADASGQWSGPFNHPGYDGGFLTLSLVDVRGSISGTYTLRLSRRSATNGRALVEVSGGEVTGASGEGGLTLVLRRTDSDWFLAGQFTARNRANGDWSLGRVRGDFSIERS